MLSPTIEEHNIKQAMVNELNFLSKEANKAGTKSIGGVESIKDFFENYSTLPIKVIFTTQTRDEVINYLYGLDKNIDVIDYFYRIKTFVNTNLVCFNRLIVTSSNICRAKSYYCIFNFSINY